MAVEEYSGLPLIDICELDFNDLKRVKALTEGVRKAATTSGFFYLKIERDFARDCLAMLEAGKQFYNMPRDELLQLAQDSESQMRIRGTPIPGTGAGLRAQGRDVNFLKDFRDSFHISVPVLDDSKIDYCSEEYSGNGKTKWPKPGLVPDGWREVLERYAEKCLKASEKLRKLFALALDLDIDYFEKPGMFDKPTCLLGVNHYRFPKTSPETSQEWKEGDPLGIKPHLDSGIFTFLLTNGVPGLERCTNFMTTSHNLDYYERIWEPVVCPDPGEGILVVNLGKNLDYWTGGKFKASLHRVVDKTQGEERFSIAFFYETNIDAVIEPLVPDCEEVREYIANNFGGKTSICAADLLLDRLKKSGDENVVI